MLFYFIAIQKLGERLSLVASLGVLLITIGVIMMAIG